LKTLKLILIVLSLFVFCKGLKAQNWSQQNSNTLSDLNNINFVDNNTGWAFGDSTVGFTFITGIIRKTTNGGASWNAQNMGSDSIQILSSHTFSPTSIIAVGKFQTTGDGAVIKTIDGGSSWTRDTTSIPERLFGVDFADANNGWIVGRNGYIGKTANGGIFWSTQTSGTIEELFSIDFTDLNNGHAVGAGRTILNTIDGGSIWTMADTSGLPLVDFNSVVFITTAKGWAAGASGTIITTSDSGKTWVTQNSGTTNDLFDVSFADANNGWAVGLNGTIVHTSDGGSTWNSDSSGTINDINSIIMKSTTLGWFCGGKGDIFRYSNPISVQENVLSNPRVVFYPNPFNVYTTIEFENSKKEKYTLTIYNSIGQLERQISNISNGQTRIERKSLANGLYIFQLRTDNEIIGNRKLIIK